MRWCNFSLARLGDVRTRIRLVMLARLGLARCRRCAPPHHFGISKPASALPSELAAWDMEMRMFGLPTPWAGPKRASRMLRDLIVTVTTLAVVDQFGLPLTTRSPRRRNACEIVAMALGSVGISIGHKGVGTDAPASRLLLAGRRCSGFNSDLYGRTHNRTASITWNQTCGGRLYSATIAPGQSRESLLIAGGMTLPPIRSAVAGEAAAPILGSGPRPSGCTSGFASRRGAAETASGPTFTRMHL
jgi:hypothetical protein